jgi:hypothetical protein
VLAQQEALPDLAAAAQPPAAWVQAITNAVAQFQSRQARPVVANPVRSLQAALDAGVNTVFDRLTKLLLSGLPGNQITDAVTGALLSPTEEFTNVLQANGQWAGSLNAADPGEVLKSTVTGAPAHGSVQINPDGTYTYTPDNGYIGTDNIIIKVTDPGFDIFRPFVSRTESVTAKVDTSIATPDATGFIYPSIKNVGKGNWGFTIGNVVYTFDFVPATRQKQIHIGVDLQPGATYFLADYPHPVKARPPGPGIYFDYIVTSRASRGTRSP